MIKSMTAFGSSETKIENQMVTVEVRSLNHRYREIVVRLPRYLMAMEDRIKQLIGPRFFRGMIEVTVTVKPDKEANAGLQLNLPLAESYHLLVKKLQGALKIEEPISLDMILACEGVITAEDVATDIDTFWDGLCDAIREAFDAVEAMKKAEGDALCADLLKRLDKIEGSINQVREKATSLSLRYYDRLKERIAKFTENMVEIDPNRLAQEAAFLAERSDVTEELVRLSSHVRQFHTIIDSEEPAGRPLIFLLQEMNREANTIGSKIGDAGLAHVVIEIKSELEKIREQVQNVE